MRSPGEAAREGVAGVWWCVVYERRSSSTTIHLYHTTIHHPASSIRTEVPPIQKLSCPLLCSPRAYACTLFVRRRFVCSLQPLLISWTVWRAKSYQSDPRHASRASLLYGCQAYASTLFVRGALVMRAHYSQPGGARGFLIMRVHYS